MNTEIGFKATPGMTVRVYDYPNKEWADLTGAKKIIVNCERPDGSVVQRDANLVPYDERRIEVNWHVDDLTLAGQYVGEVRITYDDGREIRVAPAFKLIVGGPKSEG